MENSEAIKSSQYSSITKACRKLIFNTLSSASFGSIVIEDDDGYHHFEGRLQRNNIQATIKIHDSCTYRDMVFGGSIGAAEAYMSGDWSSPNLTNVIRYLSLNLATINTLDSGLSWLKKPIQLIYHLANKNTPKGSRRNIAAHYDLGNDLFKLFLDPTMMYSAAIFPDQNGSLEDASIYKLDRICRKLNLTKNDSVIEIGTGWGGFAIHAAKHYGCTVTTTTLSDQQYQYAISRVKEENLEDKVKILKEDYRNLTGNYDKLVSIEMVEAVGHQYYNAYFKALGELLKPDGIGLIQAITMDHERHKRSVNDVDFIQRYIFPGSCIPSTEALLNASNKSSDLQLTHVEDITPHYAKTLNIWRSNFFNNIDKIRQLGYSEEFIRMWDYYFCYCEGGFQERVIQDVQMVFSKPLNRSRSILGVL